MHVVLLYTLFPLLATVLGAWLATFRAPGPAVRSGVQHLAAGVVFAAVALELLPEVVKSRAWLPTLLGFVLALGLMLGVRKLTESDEETPSGLLIAMGVDLLIDGLLLGVAVAAGARQGLLLTVALTLEVMFLALAGALSLLASGASRSRTLGLTAGLALLLMVGALAGYGMSGALTGSALIGMLAFGTAALLYLVTEELLVEAHEVPETPLLTSMFFLGFALVLMLEMVQ